MLCCDPPPPSPLAEPIPPKPSRFSPAKPPERLKPRGFPRPRLPPSPRIPPRPSATQPRWILAPKAPRASPAQWPWCDRSRCRGVLPRWQLRPAPGRLFRPWEAARRGQDLAATLAGGVCSPNASLLMFPRFRGGSACPGHPPNMPEDTTASRLRLAGLSFLLQILTIILFAVFVRYSPESGSGPCSQQLNCSWKNRDLGFQHPREYPRPGWVQRVALPGPQALLRGEGMGCHRVQALSHRPARRLQQRRGNIKAQGWGTGASHPGGWAESRHACKDFPRAWTKPSPKQGYLGLGRAFQQREHRGDRWVQPINR